IIKAKNSTVGLRSFFGCEALKTIAFDEAIETISFEDYVFGECTGLESVTVGNGVTSIGSYAFSDCTSLESAVVYDSVETIEYGAFEGCTSLKEITLPFVGCSRTESESYYDYNFGSIFSYSIPESLESVIMSDSCTSIPERAFENCSGLKYVTLSPSITSIGEDAFAGCSESLIIRGYSETYAETYAEEHGIIFEYINSMGSGNGKITARFDYSETVNPYKGLIIKTKGLEDGREYTCFVTASNAVVMNGFEENQDYMVQIVSDRGAVFGTAERVSFDENYFAEVIFDDLSPRMDAVLEVTDENSNAVSGYTVQWYLAENNNWLGSGNTVKDVTTGTQLSYTVTLSEALAVKYSIPEKQFVTVGADGKLVLKLSPLVKSVMKGTVKAADGTPLRADITIVQEITEKISPSTVVSSDAAGAYSAEVIDVPVTVIVRKVGYKDYKASGNLSDFSEIVMEEMSGSKIKLELSAKQIGIETTQSIDGVNDIDFEVKVSGKAVSEAVVQYPYIFIPETELNKGDKISVTAYDLSGKYIPAKADFEYEEVASDTAEICFTPKGCIYIHAQDTANVDNAFLVFNSKGEKVDSVSMLSFSATSTALDEGSYTVVVIGHSSLLGSVPYLSMLEEYGLEKGVDYYSEKVKVKNNEITELTGFSIPRLDETKLYYTDPDSTSIYSNTSVVSVGQMLLIRAEYGFDEETAKNVKDTVMRVNIPENCDVVLNSVTFNGYVITNYTLDNGVMTVPTDGSSGVIRFYVRPVSMNESEKLAFSANLEFEISGKEVIQPVGSVQIKVKEMEFNIPSKTCKSSIIATGKASPDVSVEIYVNDVLTGTSKTNSAGSFSVPFELVNPMPYKTYEVYAKIIAGDGSSAVSRTKEITYDEGYIAPSKVTMLNTGDNGPNVSVFDFENPSAVAPKYRIYPGRYPTFTFKVEFTQNDPSKISDVYVVTTDSSGNNAYVPVEFSEALNCWTGTYDYDARTAPVSVSVSYEAETEFPENIPGEYGEIYADIYDEYLDELDKYLDGRFTSDEGIVDENGNYVTKHMVDNKLIMTSTVTDLGYENFNIADWEDKFYYEYGEENDVVYEMVEYTDTTQTTYYASVSEETYFKIDYVFEDYSGGNGSELMGISDSVKMFSLGSDTLELASNLAGNLPGAFGAFSGLLNMVGDLVVRSKQLSGNVDILNGELGTCYQLIMAQCKTGGDRLEAMDKARFLMEYSQIADGINDYLSEMTKMISAYGVMDTLVGTGFDALGLKLNGVGDVYGSYKKIFRTMQKTTGHSGKGRLSNVAKSRLEALSDYGERWVGTVDLIPDPKDLAKSYAIDKIKKIMDLSKLIEEYYCNLQSRISEFRNKIISAYKDCDEEPEPPKPQTPPQETKPIIDPSGYVCEAVISNRLEGVTTTCFYSPYPNGADAVVWDAAEYDQMNPLLTDSNGYYEWFVPEGWWQVRYEKNGYEVGYSGWLPVPPPQTEVHYSMTSTAAPQINTIYAYSDYVELRFSQYMDISTVNSKNVVITMNGNAINGTISPVNAEESFNNPDVQYASIFRFVPSSGTVLNGKVNVSAKNLRNYAGTLMNNRFTADVSVTAKPESISAEQNVSMKIGESKVFAITVGPENAGAEKVVTIVSSNPGIVSVSEQTVITDENGNATVTLKGELPGVVSVSYEIEDSDVMGMTSVSVGIEKKTCEEVVASVASGSTVDEGTTVTLSTATLGAEIYYTTDSTCPCIVDSESRIRYTGPITLTDSVRIIAYAVREGYNDSGTSVFNYTVRTKAYTVTWVVDGEETKQSVSRGNAIEAPADPKKSGYKFMGWTPEVPDVMPGNDLTFTAVFEKAYICPECGEEIFGDAAIDAHIVAEARMKATVKIKNNSGSKTINYGETLRLTATATDKPADVKICWYIDGVKKGEGETFDVSFENGTKTVEVKLTDSKGNVLKDSKGNEISDSEKVTVNGGFFQKIISFFKNLFGMNRTVVQVFFKGII
ncbi:MAG: leucine-rich repeat protein, partial [Clostridia bacterium]|nr:leucine-rich repeat protein [Clostridia bacterium]